MILYNFLADPYHRSKFIGSGGMKQLIKSIAHYQNYLTSPPKETEEMLIGTLLHASILEPDTLDSLFAGIAVKPEGMSLATKEGKEWKAVNEGKKIISAESKTAIDEMHHNIVSHPLYKDILTGGNPETSIFVKDYSTGIHLKARPDYLIHWHDGLKTTAVIVDIKTMKPPIYPMEAFRYAVKARGINIQMAHYRRVLLNELPGVIIDHHYIVAVENEPPYLVKIYDLDASTDLMLNAEYEIETALNKFKRYKTAESAEIKQLNFGYPANIELVK